jgi:hypothetical protein
MLHCAGMAILAFGILVLYYWFIFLVILETEFNPLSIVVQITDSVQSHLSWLALVM